MHASVLSWARRGSAHFAYARVRACVCGIAQLSVAHLSGPVVSQLRREVELYSLTHGSKLP